MSTFARLQNQSRKFIQKLVDFSGLPYPLVENVYQYAKCLRKPGHLDIDENVFIAQMTKHFNLTSTYMLSLMYNALKGEKSTMVSLESFCRCICTFLCTNQDLRINYVFHVYDLNKDGLLTYMELYTFLKPCILTHDDEMDSEDSLKELIEMVMIATDFDQNGEIELEEFRRLVKSNVLYLQLLGPCMPSKEAVKAFRERLENKGPFEIRKEFELERGRCLHDVAPKEDFSLYPVVMQMP